MGFADVSELVVLGLIGAAMLVPGVVAIVYVAKRAKKNEGPPPSV